MTATSREVEARAPRPVGSASVSRLLRQRATRRAMLVTAIATLVVTSLFIAALLSGAAALTPQDVGAALVGRGDAVSSFVVWELRMPRALAAVTVGACLGAAGAVFQTVLRNPLASPDIIGVTASAGTAGVFSVLMWGLSGITLALTVTVGGIVAALLVGLLAWRNGLPGLRLVLIGIGVGALATALTSYLLTRAEVRDAGFAYSWLVGSLNGATWPVVGVAGGLALAGFVLLSIQHRGLRALELGDSTAAALGFRVDRTRIGVLASAVLLAAVAVGAGGPIGFVALVAPHITLRLIRRTSLSIVASASVGAAILTVADLIAQYAIPSISFPVGVVTGAIGAPYLAWLLSREGRTDAGGTR